MTISEGLVRHMSAHTEMEKLLSPIVDGAIANYIYEVGHLKATPRSGWSLAGISNPESVADHSFRTAVIGVVLACLEDVDPGRTALLCLFHDTAETRLGDIPSVGKKYLRGSHTEVVSDQTKDLPADLTRIIFDLVGDFDSHTSPEAILARDADKLECLAQAIEYVESGSEQARSWIDALSSEVVSPGGREISRLLQATPSNEWWRSFVESYRSDSHTNPQA